MKPFETPKAKATPVADLLENIAAELRDLTQVVDDLQLLVGRLVSISAIRGGDAMRELQNFDRLGQTISGVANFAAALGESADSNWSLNVQPTTRAVHLSDLAARLASRHEGQTLSGPIGAGELEFF